MMTRQGLLHSHFLAYTPDSVSLLKKGCLKLGLEADKKGSMKLIKSLEIETRLFAELIHYSNKLSQDMQIIPPQKSDIPMSFITNKQKPS